MTPAVSSEITTNSPRIRLEYLDGLRGLSALYVVLYHARSLVTDGLPGALRFSNIFFGFGRFAVAIFIVLSGYCLMLPVARSARGKLSGGMIAYLKRRSQRILPPYYAALVFSLLLVGLVPGVHSETKNIHSLGDFSPVVILAHVFMFHNICVAWADKINPPMWSVATEWQIYFIFPVLLLPLWKRLGLIRMVMTAFVFSLVPYYAFGASDLIAPWFLGLFAFGMAGSIIGFSNDSKMKLWRENIPWSRIATYLFTAFVITLLIIGSLHQEEAMRQNFRWILDALIGLATTALLICYTKFLTTQRVATQEPATRIPIILRMLQSRAAVLLGSFSYSLYLIHNPLLETTNFFLVHLHLSSTMRLIILISCVVPLCVSAAYVFHLLFEKPFMNSPKSKSSAIPGSAPSASPTPVIMVAE